MSCCRGDYTVAVGVLDDVSTVVEVFTVAGVPAVAGLPSALTSVMFLLFLLLPTLLLPMFYRSCAL
jgi:hypothetical protein